MDEVEFRSQVDLLLEANASYAESFANAGIGSPPSLGIAVVTCMDARIDVYKVLGLAPGEAHVIRNAGGLVTDEVIRSLCLSQRTLGTEAVVVMQHTQCGLDGLDGPAFEAALAAEVGESPSWRAGGFSDVRESVAESLAKLRGSPFLQHRDHMVGLVYDVATGRLEQVAASD